MKPNEPTFPPIKNIRNFEKVSSIIKEMIFDGRLRPGDRLPSEQELSRQFEVGRQTIREALRILELSGFICVQQGYGGGSIVKESITAELNSMIIDAFRLSKISVDEFVSARLVIEKTILNDALDKINPEDIELLRENVEKAKSLLTQKKLPTAVNVEFHSLLAKASKNSIFIILEGAIQSLHFELLTRSSINLNRSKIAVKAHEEILDALINKRRGEAQKLLEDHIKRIKNAYNTLDYRKYNFPVCT